MKSNTMLMVLAAVLLAGGWPPGAAAKAERPSAAMLLEKAIYAEHSAGDLDEAIQIYRTIVADAAAARPYVAKARYRLAMCNLKKGRKTAAAAELRALLASSPQDKALVGRARKELTKLSPTSTTGAAPIVTGTTPKAMADDVDPSLGAVSVTFDRPMMAGSWSFTGGGKTFPRRVGAVAYDAAGLTCTMPVKLQPGTVYWVGVNSPTFRNFKSVDGTPARRYVVLFATRSADGEPTPLPKKLLEQARAVNAAVVDDRPITNVAVPQGVLYKIMGSYLQVAMSYWTGGRQANAHIYVVTDEDRLVVGGLLPVYNYTGKPWTKERRLTSSSFNDWLLFDMKNLDGSRPRHRWVENPRKGGGRFVLMWTPRYPLNPGDSRLFFWQRPEAVALEAGPNGTSVRMQNHLGAHGLEQFFLVVPVGRTVADVSRPWTSTFSAAGCDVYCFQREVAPETNNVVTAVVKPAGASEGKSQDGAPLVAAAANAATAWLALVDEEKYAESWREAAPFFRSSITQKKWTAAVGVVRKPLGALRSRERISAQVMTTLPGAPDGRHVVTQFKSAFAAKKDAVETVTATEQKDGSWRVSGYFIK